MMQVGFFFTSTDVSNICHGCVVSQYPPFYEKVLKKYNVFTHLYLGTFQGDNGKN